jgi:Bacterial antitoxin of type II TA system, VapB
MISNIDIDETVVAEAMRLSGARTKREVVDRALREMVARASRPSVRALFGIGGVDPAYDPKMPWAHKPAEIGQYRVEEPRSHYASTRQAVTKPAAAVKPATETTVSKRPAKR